MMVQYSEEDKSTHLALWRESGLSKQAYSKASGVGYKTFLKWSKSCVGMPSVPQSKKEERFISVAMESSSSIVSDDFIEVRYPNGVIVKLPMGSPISLVKALLP